MKKYILLLPVILASACSTPQGERGYFAAPLSPSGSPGVTVGFTMPIGTATTSTQTTQAPNTFADVSADDLRADIELYRAARLEALKDRDADTVDQAFKAIQAAKDELHRRGLTVHQPFIDTAPGVTAVGTRREEYGFWKGLLFDYRTKGEGVKTSFSQIAIAYLGGLALHETGLVDMSSLPFYSSDDNSAALNRASQSLDRASDSAANKNIVRGNNNEVTGLPQGERLVLDGSGNTVAFQPAPEGESFAVQNFEPFDTSESDGEF